MPSSTRGRDEGSLRKTDASPSLPQSFFGCGHWWLGLSVFVYIGGAECAPLCGRDEDRGFRLSANLKRELLEIAKLEGRTLSQLCELFVIGGLEAYKKQGSKYVQRVVGRPKDVAGAR
jgi:hypothetical protein